MNWFHITRRQEVAHAAIFGEIGAYGIGAVEFLEQIGDARKIQLTISSAGGNSSDALAIHDALISREAEVELVDRCYSAAITIAMAGRVIRARAGARLMLHRPCNHFVGDSDELREEARRFDKMTEQIVGIVMHRTRQPRAVVERWYASGPDTYFSAEQAMAVGLIDEILTPAPVKAGRTSNVASDAPAGPPQFSDAENLLLDFMHALGPMRVRSRERLGRELAVWFTHEVKEQS